MEMKPVNIGKRSIKRSKDPHWMKELTELTTGLHILIIKLKQLVKHKPNSLLQWRVEVNLRKLADKKRGSRVSSIVCIKQANFFASGAQLYWLVKLCL